VFSLTSVPLKTPVPSGFEFLIFFTKKSKFNANIFKNNAKIFKNFNAKNFKK